MQKLLGLDFYNKNFFLQSAEITYVWRSQDDFMADSVWPFTDANIISWEPERNIFVVERTGGVSDPNRDSPELLWIADNFSRLQDQAKVREENERFKPDLTHDRMMKLGTTDWLVVRHTEQKYIGTETTLTESQMTELSTYRQAIRDLTNTYPADTLSTEIEWPTPPNFI